MAAKNISIVIPTYTGLATIGRTLDSIYNQEKSAAKHEVIVVIDGPSPKLRALVEKYKAEFTRQNIEFKIKQFSQNKGRFMARLAGAELAKNEHLVLVDDRIELATDFLLVLAGLNQDMVMPNVIEETDRQNLIAFTLLNIRRLVYGSKWGKDFDDYYITGDNFEKSPKGTTTTTLRSVFVRTCRAISKQQAGKDSHTISDDTAILRSIIDQGHQIFRTSKLKVFYQPRAGLREATAHLFNRGPKFVDYYLRSGTRFFPALVFFYALLVAGLLSLIWLTSLALLAMSIALAVLLAACVAVTKKPLQSLRLFIGAIFVIIIFCAGLLRGSLRKVIGI